MRCHFSNNNGYSITEALIAGALLFGVISSSLVQMNSYRKQQSQGRAESSLAMIRETILASINDQSSWDVTKTKNVLMSCDRSFPATCANNTSGKIRIYNAASNLITDSTVSTSGFNYDGSVCNAFSAKGNDQCPFHASVTWKIQCANAQACQYPEELVSVVFSYAPKSTSQVINLAAYNINNLSRINLGDNSSPMVTCVSMNKLFVGFGNSVSSGDGLVTTADAYGCVPLVALRGRTGPQGPQGPRGPAGSAGSDAHTVSLASSSVPLNDPCTQSANAAAVCAAYSSELNRVPDQSGFDYYLSQLNSGQMSITSMQGNIGGSIESLAVDFNNGNNVLNSMNNATQVNGLLASSADIGQIVYNNIVATGADPQSAAEFAAGIEVQLANGADLQTATNNASSYETKNP